MFFQAREKMQVIKDLYHSRHYTQCAKLGERLLSEAQHDEHPIHLAYLNFYTAIAHDTLAREATRKNRHRELALADKHYVAAISLLTPPELQHQEDSPLSSPASVSTAESRVWRRRTSEAGSFDSTCSIASSNTSYSVDPFDMDSELKPKPLRCQPSPCSSRSGTTSPNPTKLARYRSDTLTVSHYRPETPAEYQLCSNTLDFIHDMERHLANVRELKRNTIVPTVRFSFPASLDPEEPETPRRTASQEAEEKAEAVRCARRQVVFRPRFDPTSVRRLCSDALWDIS